MISMHELVIGKKAPVGHVIDHINNNGLCNIKENIHVVTYSQNSQNKKKLSGRSSMYIGVHLDKEKRWTSTIRINRKQTHIGIFDDEIDGGKAADEIFKNIYGKDALLNNPNMSIRTTKHNRIPDEMITKKFIESITTIKDLKHIIRKKKLCSLYGGDLKLGDVNSANFEKMKGVVSNKLFVI